MLIYLEPLLFYLGNIDGDYKNFIVKE